VERFQVPKRPVCRKPLGWEVSQNSLSEEESAAVQAALLRPPPWQGERGSLLTESVWLERLALREAQGMESQQG